MAKRAARRAKLHAIDSARVHNLIFDHTPAIAIGHIRRLLA